MPASDMTIRQLRGLVTLSRTGGVTAAAHQLGMTQPGLTLLLQSLENALGTKLIDRSSRPFALTDAGRRFLPIAERILEDLEIAASSVQDERLAGGRINVAALPTLAAALLPDAIARFNKRNPTVTVQVRDLLTEEVVNRVRSGDAHIGLGAFLNIGEDLIVQPLFQDRLMVLDRRGGEDRKSVTWQAAAARPLVLLTRDSNIRQLADRVFIEKGLDVRPAYEVGYINTAVAFARAGFGATIVPQLETRIFARGPLRATMLVDPPVRREISVLMRRNFTLRPAVREFIAILRELRPA